MRRRGKQYEHFYPCGKKISSQPLMMLVPDMVQSEKGGMNASLKDAHRHDSDSPVGQCRSLARRLMFHSYGKEG